MWVERGFCSRSQGEDHARNQWELSQIKSRRHCSEVTAERVGRAVIGDDADGARWVQGVSGWVRAAAVRNRGRRENPGGLANGLLLLLGSNAGAGLFPILLSFSFFVLILWIHFQMNLNSNFL